MDRSRHTRFDSAVEKFLRANQLSSVVDIISNNLLEAFLIEPTISAYLTRPSQDVTFNAEGEPIYISHYESEFYESCRKEESNYIPFRAITSYYMEMDTKNSSSTSVKTASFYKSGTSDAETQVLNQSIHRALENKNSSQETDNSVFLVSNGYDTYQIGGLLRNLQGEETRYQNLGGIIKDSYGKEIKLPNTGFSFLIFPTDKDYHAITIFALFDNTSKKVITTGLCNSSAQEEYSEYYHAQLNREAIDDSAGEKKLFSFIDCSHHLQTEENDYNCGLYRANFIHALTSIIVEEENIAKTLIENALPAKELGIFIREGMKEYLPQYYKLDKGNFVETTLQERMLSNLELRWEAGNMFLRDRITEIKRNIQQQTQLLQ